MNRRLSETSQVVKLLATVGAIGDDERLPARRIDPHPEAREIVVPCVLAAALFDRRFKEEP